ncbi:MAG TPA: hypothetical protein VNZ53_11155 [Steroidobacteraceae bacterium]|jgi:hypothetical protein|nr:hypothetical protein [Steroidobacteraceae bacterium]
MDLPVMADSRMDAIINAPCESIDLTAWVFGLTDKDGLFQGSYRRSSQFHGRWQADVDQCRAHR